MDSLSSYYNDSLSSFTTSKTVPPDDVLPSYIGGSDGHNYANGNFAITDPSTWGQGLSDAGKFVVSAAASGVNSFYNTGATVANWLGADIEQNDVAVQLGAMDDDLGNYYRAHRQSADLAGFVATSFIPGMAGIKLLNMGQKVLRTAQETGILGATLSRATGLLAPSTEVYKTLAAADIASSGVAYNTITANTLKAITSGYGQAALESAAFEVAVQATMFKSPTLDDMDGWDIAKNMAMGSAVGGVIGGAINHAISGGAIKKAAKGFNETEKPFTNTLDVTGLTDSQAIIARQTHLDNIPQVPSTQDILEGKVPGTQQLIQGLPAADQQVIASNLNARLTRISGETQNKLELANRQSMQTLTKGSDTELANTVADMVHGIDANQTFANFAHLTSLGRVGTKLPEESLISAFNKDAAKNLTTDLDAGSNTVTAPAQIGYVKMIGPDAGTVTMDTPKILNIADTSKSVSDVQSKVDAYKFGSKANMNKVWDATAVDHTEAEARYLWADKLSGENFKDGMSIGEYDIPMLEAAIKNKVSNINVVSDVGNYPVIGADNIAKHVQVSKQEAATALLKNPDLNTDEIAKITNVRTSLLEGTQNTTAPHDDWYAYQSDKSNYMNQLQQKGLLTTQKADDFGYTPSYFKAAYDTKQLQDIDGNIINGMAYIKAQQKQYMLGIDTAFAANVPPELLDQFTRTTDTALLAASRNGSGPGLFRFANGAYGSVESWTEQLGSATSRLQKILKDSTTDALQSHAYGIANDQEAAIAFEAINKHITSNPERYGFNADGDGLVPLKLLDYQTAIAAGKNVDYPIMAEGTVPFFPIENQKALEAWTARTQLTGDRTVGFQDIRNAQGLTDMKDPRALRAIRPNLKDYPYFAIVTDPAITGVGQKSMIHATSAKDLDAMIAKVPDNYQVFKKSQIEDYKKAYGEFDYEQSLHENYIDADLKSNGIDNPFFIKTDPAKIAQDFMADHLRSDDIFARELVNAKYEPEFNYFRQQSAQSLSTESSTYTGSYRSVESKTNDPYQNYIKTALNISQIGEHPYLQGLNTALDAGVSKAWDTITSAFSAVKTPADLDTVNKLIDKYGVSTGYYDAATNLLANAGPNRGVLTSFVSKANSLLTTLVTRLDPMNAINNAIGSTVLTGTELTSILSAIKSGNKDVAGGLAALKDLTTTPVPSGWMTAGEASAQQALNSGAIDSTLNAGKLIQNAISNFMNKDATNLAGEKLTDWYTRNGFNARLVDQFHSLMDDLAYKPNTDPGLLNGLLQSAIDKSKVLAEKGEMLTGNKLAESFNRFTAVDAMRQISDIAVARGAISSDEQLSYMQTFLNRTQGNMLASQRPLMFQGPVGQAIGLFQSYQFNMMQQLFRHVAEGTPKDTAMLLGLQGTMYGMNGLPAFNFLNTHILGTMSGNPTHNDLYTQTYGIAGKSIGDLLLYGMPSNLLRGNLYSRGDINPRNATVIPTNPLDIPFINATIRTYDMVKDNLNKIQQGGNLWESMLQGIEHNGLSRPLAGIAQTAQAITNGGTAFSTTSKGNIGGANDLLSWATAVRLAGGRPLDEAIANDASYRVTAYSADNKATMDALNQSVKTTLIGGQSPTGDQVSNFAKEYAAVGGKQSNFNKYMMTQFKNANTNQANKIIEALKNPQSQHMQQIMGGTEVLDTRGVAPSGLTPTTVPTATTDSQ